MLRLLKSSLSLIIFLCLFLPLSQCEFKNPPPVDEKTGAVVHPHEAEYEVLVLSNSLLGGEDKFSVEHAIVLLTFLIPLVFALLSFFSVCQNLYILGMQTLFSAWLIYFSNEIVFMFSNPLAAGWLLIVSAVSFLTISVFEFFMAMKHNKFKNESASKAGTDAQKDARPF